MEAITVKTKHFKEICFHFYVNIEKDWQGARKSANKSQLQSLNLCDKITWIGFDSHDQDDMKGRVCVFCSWVKWNAFPFWDFICYNLCVCRIISAWSKSFMYEHEWACYSKLFPLNASIQFQWRKYSKMLVGYTLHRFDSIFCCVKSKACLINTHSVIRRCE